MIRGIVAGALFRGPEEKLSKANRPYTILTIRSGGGDATRWVRALLFNDEARAAVAGMAAGEAIAVSGELDCEVYVPEGGQPRISWSVRADAVLTAKTGARKLSATEPEQPQEERDAPLPF
jgi:hypothetical protein